MADVHFLEATNSPDFCPNLVSFIDIVVGKHKEMKGRIGKWRLG